MIRISQSEITLVFYGRDAAAVRTPVMTVQTLLDPKVVFTQMSYPKRRFFRWDKTFFRRVKTLFQKWVMS